jgi:hypothetical protein
MELNGTHQLLMYDDDFNIQVENVNIIKKNTAFLLQAIRDDGLEVNTGKTKYMVVFSPKCRTKSQFTNCQ